ncbi:MAG: hypothetical protein ABI036_00910 [Fibrobacteria bacterium]
MDKVYSNKLSYALLKFLEQRYGKRKSDEFLENAKLDRLKLADQSGFMTAAESDALARSAIEVSGEKDIYCWSMTRRSFISRFHLAPGSF